MTSTPQPKAPPAAPGPPAGQRGVEVVSELEELETLAERPLGEHVAVFDAVHRALSEQLRGAES